MNELRCCECGVKLEIDDPWERVLRLFFCPSCRRPLSLDARQEDEEWIVEVVPADVPAEEVRQ